MISSSKFYYDADTLTYSAEVSELGPVIFETLPLGDGNGIRIHFEDTGKTALFMVNHVDRNEDGDIMSWRLVPTPETVRELFLPLGTKYVTTKVVIFND